MHNGYPNSYQSKILFNRGLDPIPTIPLPRLEELYLYESDIVYRKPQSLPTLLQSILHIYTEQVELSFWRTLKIQEIKMTLAYHAGNLEELLYAGRICAQHKFFELFAVENVTKPSIVFPEYTVQELLQFTSQKLEYTPAKPTWMTNHCLIHYVLYTDFCPNLFEQSKY